MYILTMLTSFDQLHHSKTENTFNFTQVTVTSNGKTTGSVWVYVPSLINHSNLVMNHFITGSTHDGLANTDKQDEFTSASDNKQREIFYKMEPLKKKITDLVNKETLTDEEKSLYEQYTGELSVLSYKSEQDSLVAGSRVTDKPSLSYSVEETSMYGFDAIYLALRHVHGDSKMFNVSDRSSLSSYLFLKDHGFSYTMSVKGLLRNKNAMDLLAYVFEHGLLRKHTDLACMVKVLLDSDKFTSEIEKIVNVLDSVDLNEVNVLSPHRVSLLKKVRALLSKSHMYNNVCSGGECRLLADQVMRHDLTSVNSSIWERLGVNPNILKYSLDAALYEYHGFVDEYKYVAAHVIKSESAQDPDITQPKLMKFLKKIKTTRTTYENCRKAYSHDNSGYAAQLRRPITSRFLDVCLYLVAHGVDVTGRASCSTNMYSKFFPDLFA
jgi:hypothetical protein